MRRGRVDKTKASGRDAASLEGVQPNRRRDPPIPLRLTLSAEGAMSEKEKHSNRNDDDGRRRYPECEE
jgi:hypothetical protein